ncbi:MAG: hypothetical protein RSA05_08530 [Cetobacterium sp.]
MKAVFNVYANPKNDIYSNYLFTLHEVLEAIKLGKEFHTNIMYKICNDGKLTPKELRPAHNIFKMWRSGSFCSHKENRYFK